MASNNFEEFLDSCSFIPNDVHRYMRLIKELDARYMGTRSSTADKKRELEEKQRQFGESKKDRRPELLKEIKDLQTVCLELSNEKVQIAKQSDQLVEQTHQVKKCGEKLEQELARFNKQLESKDEDFAVLGSRLEPRQIRESAWKQKRRQVVPPHQHRRQPEGPGRGSRDLLHLQDVQRRDHDRLRQPQGALGSPSASSSGSTSRAKASRKKRCLRTTRPGSAASARNHN